MMCLLLKGSFIFGMMIKVWSRALAVRNKPLKGPLCEIYWHLVVWKQAELFTSKKIMSHNTLHVHNDVVLTTTCVFGWARCCDWWSRGQTVLYNPMGVKGFLIETPIRLTTTVCFGFRIGKAWTFVMRIFEESSCCSGCLVFLGFWTIWTMKPVQFTTRLATFHLEDPHIWG